MSGSSVHSLSEFAQIHVYYVGDAVLPSHPHPLPPSTLFAFSLPQHLGLFQ